MQLKVQTLEQRFVEVVKSKRLADGVVKTGKKVELEPMNPYERRIIHSSLQSNDRVTTFSEGEEPYRKVVIALK
jgi:spoIIIJ-associated protein